MNCDDPYFDLFADASLMANGRHSFVAFYPSDWLGGTARLPRLHRSVFFDVCCFIWDTAKPVPSRELKLMIADLPEGEAIIEDLIAVGKLERRFDGSISNAKALHEAEKAYGAWQRMSEGGRQARSKDDDKGDEKGHSKGDANGSASGMPENQNQNQNQSSPKGERDRKTETAIEDANAIMSIFEAWNITADKAGLSQAVKLTDKRRAAIRARLKDFDARTICTAISRIPESDFLTGGGDRGWKADFDFVLQPSSLTKLIEGAYHGRTGKRSAWLDA